MKKIHNSGTPKIDSRLSDYKKRFNFNKEITIMENILKTLIHYRQANALLKYNNVKELECVINNLSKILAKKKSRELVLIEEQKKKADKLAVYQEVLAANGIDINELMTLVTQTAKAAKTAKTAK